MRMKLTSLLAATLLSQIVVPATAQLVELPLSNPPMSAKNSDGTDDFVPAVWFTHASDVGARWIEAVANQGPIVQAVDQQVSISGFSILWAIAQEHWMTES